MRTTAIIALASLASVAAAEVSLFEATIDGIQAGTSSPAVGNLTGTYDSLANSFSFSWSISDDLIGAPASPGSHIHRAPAGQTGPIVFAFNNPDGTWPLSGSALWTGLSSDNVADLFAGNLYVNFHTSAFLAGEVRGQILLVPAPGAGFLLAAGMVMTRRRRS